MTHGVDTSESDGVDAGGGNLGPSRRTVLAGVGGLGAVGVLAACGSPTDSAETDTKESLEPDASVNVPEKAVILAAADDVPVGGGIRILEREIVITQPQPGEFKAFGQQCPHAGCAVAEFEDGEIICPCHGSRFSAQTGDVIRGPARTGLNEVAVEVVDGQVISAVK